ncbi:MAG TPA: hypothetical protein VIM73_05745 [Polyangiaceae bacterium]
MKRFLVFPMLFALGALGCDDSESEPLVGFGRVSLATTPTQASGFVAYRKFWSPGPGCPQDVAVGDNCALSNCAYSLDDVTPPESAGRVRIQGALQEVEFNPESSGEYPDFEAEGPLFEGGEMIRFEVDGDGEIEPATSTLEAPPLVSVTAPVLAEVTEIDRSEDLEVRWASLAQGDVLISASVVLEDEQNRRAVALYCEFPAYLGSATLPAKDLAKLPSNLDGGEGELWVGMQSYAYARTGRWDHSFSLSAYEAAPVTFR